ncbi:ERF family protein [Streptomyces longwoodensis]|uniref:ERF family protein n=1 Tax=Streptomyces longwoodensis TaxID=68231 RepID=UPI0033DD4808
MAADTAEQAPDETAPPPDPATRPVWDLTVDQAFILAMREIGAVGKNGRNKEFNYQYRQQEDLVAAVRGPMAKYGVRMLPEVLEQKHFQRGKSNVAILTIKYNVRGPAGDVMEPPIIVVGEGADVSDKASNKAMTAAKKYAIVQAFEIAEENVDDGDQTSPDTEASPLDWYVDQLRREDVWFNYGALGRLRQRALQYGHGNLVMPDDTGLTLIQTIEERGNVLLVKQQEIEERKAEERQARDAQMRAEHPEYHRSSPDDQVWQQPSAPGRPQSQPNASAPDRLPDPAEVEQRLTEAMQDPQTAVKRLNEIRKLYTTAVLKQVSVQTKWGQVDGNSAITLALREVAQRPPSAPTSPSLASTERGGDPKPDSVPADDAPPPPEQAQQAREEVPAAEQPQQAPPTPVEASAKGEEARPPQPPLAEEPKRKMTRSEQARHRLEREVAFQAQMLGVQTLEYVGDLLPPRGTSLADIPGNVRLQEFIVQARPAVFDALIKAGMMRQAEEYAALGQRAPAPNIENIIDSALRVQTSL